MFPKSSTSVEGLKSIYLARSAINKTPKIPSGIVSEEFAIVTCSLLIAVFAIPILIVIQVVAAVFWGTVTVGQLLNGKGSFQEGGEF